MGKNRLEAFSDGVLAIVITIMVLELKVPHGDDLNAIIPLLPRFLSYVLSFIYVGIYWNNHHHMLHTVHHVSGTLLWANLHLLFWLSLFPVATGWMGEYPLTSLPTAVYGFVLLMAAIGYLLVQKQIIQLQGQQALLKRAIGEDWKGKISLVAYLMGIALSFGPTWIAQSLYLAVALLWLTPDRRIEKHLQHER